VPLLLHFAYVSSEQRLTVLTTGSGAGTASSTDRRLAGYWIAGHPLSFTSGVHASPNTISADRPERVFAIFGCIREKSVSSRFFYARGTFLVTLPKRRRQQKFGS
jgi:hypothetical protein